MSPGLDLEKVARPFLISYCCVNGTTSRKYLKDQSAEEIMESGVLRVLVPCVGRLSVADLVARSNWAPTRWPWFPARKAAVITQGWKTGSPGESIAPRSIWTKYEVGKDKLQFSTWKEAAMNPGPGIWAGFRAVNTETAVGK